MAEDKKIKELLAKHKPKTAEDIAKELKTMEEAKQKYTKDVAILEQNLKKFHEIIDPLVDPVSDNVLCWIRRPSMKEWEELVPAELTQYSDIREMPIELQEKFKDHAYKMMAELIVLPKHDAEWWKENTDIVFQQLFQNHLMEIYRKLGVLAENF